MKKPAPATSALMEKFSTLVDPRIGPERSLPCLTTLEPWVAELGHDGAGRTL